MGERHLQRVTHQQPGFFGPPSRGEDQGLRVEAVREHLRQLQRLRDLERKLVACHRVVGAAGEEQRTGERDRQLGEIGVALVGGEHVEGGLHVHDRLRDVALLRPGEQPQTRPNAGSRVRQPDALEPLDRRLEMRTGLGRATPKGRHLACALVEFGRAQRAVSELERLLEVPLRAVVRAEGGRPFACSDEHRLGVRPQLERIGCVGVELERRQQSARRRSPRARRHPPPTAARDTRPPQHASSCAPSATVSRRRPGAGGPGGS